MFCFKTYLDLFKNQCYWLEYVCCKTYSELSKKTMQLVRVCFAARLIKTYLKNNAIGRIMFCCKTYLDLFKDQCNWLEYVLLQDL